MNPTVACGNRASAPSSIPRPARRTGTRQTGPEISSTSVSASGVRIRTGRVGMSRVASATMMRASSFMACLNSGVGVRSSRRTASLCWLNGPSTTWRFLASGFASFIEWESLGERPGAVAQAVELAAAGLDDDLRYLAHLGLAHATRRHRCRAEPDAARDGRGLGVVRDHVLVAGDAYRLERLLQLLACRISLYQVDQDQVVVRPAGDEVEPAFEQTIGQSLAIIDDLAGVVFELGFERLTECHSLAGYGVHERATLRPGEDATVHFLGELLAAEYHAAAGAPQRLVGGRRDYLAVGDGRRVNPGRHEARDVGHVREEESPDLVGDLTEPLELQDARVGARAGQDHPRVLAQRDLAQVIVVDKAVVADAVMDEVVGPPGEVELRAVRQVPAVGQVHGKDLVAGFGQDSVRLLVRLAPRMRLHVGVICAEELLRPVYGELLHHVHKLAAAVVALARVALGVLVRHHRALGCEHRRGGKVLARYQLDGRPLAFELPVERLLDRRIYNLGVRT